MKEEDLKEMVDSGEVDPDRDVEELDLEGPMHPGIFTGAKRFRWTHVHEGQWCGANTYNQSYSYPKEPVPKATATPLQGSAMQQLATCKYGGMEHTDHYGRDRPKRRLKRCKVCKEYNPYYEGSK